MTDKERQELRKIQDRWLAKVAVQHHIRNHGDHTRIFGWNTNHGPTFADVARFVYADLKQWFLDELE